jgi:hypothetical protein
MFFVHSDIGKLDGVKPNDRHRLIQCERNTLFEATVLPANA